MEQDIIKVCLNPVRQRIMQYIIVHGSGTPGQIAAELYDVPKASLYRHIRILLEAGVLEVKEERRVRGAVERTYGPVEHQAKDYSMQELGQLMQSSLMSIAATFSAYFAGEDADPVRDLLAVSQATLLLTDSELIGLLQGIGALMAPLMNNAPEEERKPRVISLVSSPVINKEEKK